MESNRTRTSPLPIQDSPFATSGNRSFLSRLADDRSALIQLSIAVVVLVLGIGAIALIYNSRANSSAEQLSSALQTFAAPIRSSENPLPSSVRSFGSEQERAKAANAEFTAIADKYGMMPAGRNAQYLAGITSLQLGQNSAAEARLKKGADSWNNDIANLSRLALANLYSTTGRQSDAIAEYKKSIDHPSNLVPSGLARLQLADMYASNGNAAEAKKIYAEIKDKDPKSAAAELANEKLNGPAAR